MDYDVLDFCQAFAERYVLSKAVNNIDYYYELTSKIEPSDLLDRRNFILFNTLKALHEEKDIKAFDFHAVETELQANSATDLVDSKYLDLIYNYMDSDDGNFDIYIKDILEASTKYKLFKSLNKTSKKIIDSLGGEEVDSGELLGNVQSEILDLSSLSLAIAEPRNVSEGIVEYLEGKRKTYQDMSGISTGYPILNTQIDGLIPGTLFVVAARKKMGKSALLTNMAAHVALIENKPVLYIDTEMTFPEWRDRLIACITGIPERTIKHGGYDDEMYAKIKRAIKVFENKKFYHEYMPGYSIDKITALYKKYKMKEDIAVAFFDYIKEPQFSASASAQRKEYQILGDVATRLKDLAGSLDIPFVAAAQVNRQGDIADSDRIARYGDVIAFWMTQDEKLMEEHQKKIGGYKLVIKDSRRGGGTSDDGIGYYFWKDRLRIREVPPDRQLFNYEEGEVTNYGTADDEEELL
jgi:replicative DNA helicase